MKTRRIHRRGARKTRHRRRTQRGGSNIPRAALVPVQQDPYSARYLVDYDTAEKMWNETNESGS
jgi:hypothetical protein